MNGSAMLAGLTKEQRAAASVLQGPLLIKAGPGSGKTRTVTHRIAYGVSVGAFDPFKTLALTFTTRAAAELNRRLSALGAPEVAARTFHSAAMRQLRHFWPEVVGEQLPKLESKRAGLLIAAVERCGFSTDPDTVADIVTELDWVKGRCMPLAHYAQAAADRPLPLGSPQDVADVLAAYEAEKTDRGVIDFDDVLLIMTGLLESQTSIRESVRRTYRWFTVDEYQDVSPLQQRLLDLWVGDRQDLCVVGDPAQSIYQFAGSDPDLLLTFPQRYPRAEVHTLSTTYRCSAAVTDVVNALAGGIPHSVTLTSATQEVGSVQVLRFPSDDGEARGLADEIGSLIAAGADPAQIAVLFRANHQARRFEAEFQRRQIPYSVRGTDRFFDRPEVREAATRLRGQWRAASEQPVTDALEAVWQAMGHTAEPPLGATPRLRWESLQALAGLFAGRDDLPVGSAVADLEARIAHNDPPEPAGAALMTLHAAKGLEWDTVFVAGAWSGMIPQSRAHSGGQLMEERRLAYVGFSRAARRLVVSYGSHARGGARRDPSPFVSEALTPVAGDPVTRTDQPDERPTIRESERTPSLQGQLHAPARCRVCGQSLVTGSERVLRRCRRCPALPDPGLLERLHVWRAAQAHGAGLPEYAVLTQATLLAIAELEPSTIGQLAAIPGFTDDRLAMFGEQILELIAVRSPG